MTSGRLIQKWTDLRMTRAALNSVSCTKEPGRPCPAELLVEFATEGTIASFAESVLQRDGPSDRAETARQPVLATVGWITAIDTRSW